MALPGIGGLIAGGAPPVVTWLGVINGSSGSIVVPRAGLLVVGAVGFRTGSGTRQISNINIGGNSATPPVRTAAANHCTGMRQREVSAGTISVSCGMSGGAADALAMCAWLVENYQDPNYVYSHVTTYGNGPTNHRNVMDYVNPSVGLVVGNKSNSAAVTITPPEDFTVSQTVGGSYNLYAATHISDGGELGYTIQSSSTNNGNCVGMVFN